MGLSGGSQKTSTKPVYSQAIEGAAGDITGAYRTQQPKIANITDSLSTLVPGLLDSFTKGDANVNAARGYNADVLSSKYLSSPYLDNIVSQGETDARNQTAAALGTRGLTGGSAFGDIISRNVANAGNQLRYTDWNNQLTRMDNAAAQAPALSAAQYQALAPVFDILGAQSAPIQAATGAGAGVGGLLGSYTNSKVQTNQSLGSILGQVLGAGAAGWASGGFKGV